MAGIVPTFYFDWAGYLGVALYLAAYAALQTGVIRGSGYAYTLLNLAAASLVLASLHTAFNMSSALIQGSWIVISLAGLARTAILNRTVRFSDEDRSFLNAAFPGMPRPMARRFLDSGTWVSADPGAALTREGAPVTALFFLLNGRADVFSGDRLIGEIERGFIGEINVRKGRPASATVRVSSLSRLFTISGDNLRRICASDSDLRVLLENGLSEDTGKKLVAANARLLTAHMRA